MIMIGLYEQKVDAASFQTGTGAKLRMLSAGLVGGWSTDATVDGIPVGAVMEPTQESPVHQVAGELLDMVFGIESLNLAALGVVNGAIDDNR